jgi:hypothetical protein
METITMTAKFAIAAAALTLGVALGGPGPLSLHEARAASVCYKGGQAYGKVASGVRKSKAQERARGKWNDYARSLMGTSRANWNNAKYRGYHCDKKGIWYCRAIATPCI